METDVIVLVVEDGTELIVVVTREEVGPDVVSVLTDVVVGVLGDVVVVVWHSFMGSQHRTRIS